MMSVAPGRSGIIGGIGFAYLGRLAAHLPALPAIPAKAWQHALATTAAAILALYVAFALELSSPGSAATTVLIVSSPLPGLVLSKSLWRFVGTFVGAVISILLIAQFAQSPAAFILALAIWLGLCTFVASLLRYFRAYAAVLAGYTISQVALPAADDPNQIFDLATSRIAVVTIGILCTAVVKGLLAMRTGPARLGPALEQALAETTRYAARALDLAPDHPARRRAIAEQLVALDPLILAAANESAATAQQAPAVRLYVSILLNFVTLSSSVRDDLAVLDPAGPVARAIGPERDMIRDLLASLSDSRVFLGAETAAAIDAARHRAAERVNEIATKLLPETLDILALSSRLKDIVEQLDYARSQLAMIESGRSGRAVTPVSYHRDAHDAVINGVRAAIATILAGAFWFATAWSSGSQLMAAVVPVVALLGTTERPDLASVAFARGIVLSSVCALICEFFILTEIDGFPLMAVAISPFLIIACLISLNPKHSGSATAFLIFFVTFLNLRNPMQFDLSAFLNSAFGIIMGAFAGVVTFRVLWPIVPEHAVARLIARLRDDLVRLAERPGLIDLPVWESTMHDRVARLSTRLAAAPNRAAVIEDGLTAIHVGRALAFAATTLASVHLAATEREAVDAAFAAMRRFARAPGAAIAACENAAQELLVSAQIPESEDATGRNRRLRSAGVFHEIAQLMRRHPDFFVAPPRPRRLIRGAVPA